MDRIFLFHSQRLINDVRPVDGAVVHVDLYLLTEQLLRTVPQNRVGIHRQTGILGIINQRIAHCLHIRAVGTHLVEAVHLAIYRVGIDVVCIDFQRVAMHEQSVFLRIIEHHSTLGGIAVARRLVVEKAVGMQFVPVLAVDIHHIAEPFVVASSVVMEQGVACYRLLLIDNRRATEQLRPVGP